MILGMIRAAFALACMLSSVCLWASDEKRPLYPFFDYDVARPHEIKPHRRTIPLEGVRPGFNQLHLTLTVSPTGDVLEAKAGDDSDSQEFWPRVQGEVRGWRFAPFEKDGKAVTAEVEEYVDLVPPERMPKTHVNAPTLEPDSKVTVELRRTGCYGTCPAYTVTVNNEGILFDGDGYVVARGRHTDSVDADRVRGLAK